MDCNLLNDDQIECKKCKSRSFYLDNGYPICDRCGLFLSNNKKLNYNEKTKNKSIHLNNVLKNIETVNVSQIDELVKIVEEKIAENNINPEFVDSTYVCEILKKAGKKSYILDIQVYNKFIQNNLRHSNTDKKAIKIIFNAFFQYASEVNPKLYNNSISYHQILHNIYKYLDVKIDIKPSLSRTKNEELNNIFEDFLNYLCETYYNNSRKTQENNFFSPEIKTFPNIFYTKE